MFKHFLTYEFALGFERDCRTLNLPIVLRNELLHCSTGMINYFLRSIQTSDRIEESKSLFVALTYLRDCNDILERADTDVKAIMGSYKVLNLRLERLLEEATKAENGQLRMLG